MPQECPTLPAIILSMQGVCANRPADLNFAMEDLMPKTETPKIWAISAFVITMALSPLAFGESTGDYIDDAAITTKVKAALLTDSHLKATEVKVETNQGAVQLSGTVNTKAQESEAIRATNQVDGVKSVEDLLTVRGTSEQ